MIHWQLSNDDGIAHLQRKALHVQSRSYWAPANIGPYSQAQTEILAQTEEGHVFSSVHIAGQIPLVPATMSFPTENEISRLSALLPEVVLHRDGLEAYRNNFALNAVLSLQHLWRVGIEMQVLWWTSAVAYLARDDLSQVRKKAQIVGAVWAFMHRPNFSESEDGEDEDLDLWEKTHHGGLETRKSVTAGHLLPDWQVVTSGAGSAETVDIYPPFFAVEVEELPRGSSVEWHAHTALTEGPLVVSGESIESVGIVQECIVAGHVRFTVVMLSYKEDMSDLAHRAEGLLRALSTGTKQKREYRDAYASYIDANIEGLWRSTSYAGVVPCRSIWDRKGARLAAVLLFKTTIS